MNIQAVNYLEILCVWRLSVHKETKILWIITSLIFTQDNKSLPPSRGNYGQEREVPIVLNCTWRLSQLFLEFLICCMVYILIIFISSSIRRCHLYPVKAFYTKISIYEQRKRHVRGSGLWLNSAAGPHRKQHESSVCYAGDTVCRMTDMKQNLFINI